MTSRWMVCVLALLLGCSETSSTGGASAAGGAPGMLEEPIRVSLIGNSITEPAGTSESPVNYPEHLVALLGDDFELANFGYGGATMSRNALLSYWTLQEFADAKAFEPQIMTIMLGTNDTKPPVWDAEAFESDYRDMIEELESLPSNPTILLLLPVPVFGANAFEIRGDVLLDEVIPIIEGLGAEHELDVVDLHTPLAESPNLFPDNVHPTAEGGLRIAEELVQPLRAAARRRTGTRAHAPARHPSTP